MQTPVPSTLVTSSLFRNTGFRNIWISQVCGQVATNLLHFALVLQTFTRTGSTLFVGILIAVISLPPILFSTFGGLVADRYDRRLILASVNGIRAVIAVFLVFGHTNIPLTLAAVFLLTTCSEFFMPAESASIPVLVPVSQLVAANSLIAFTLYASFLAGYTLAGPLLHWGGPMATIVCAALLYGIAAVFTLGIPSLVSHLHAANGILKRGRDTFVAQLMAGLHFIRGHHILGLVTFEIAVLFGIERGIIALIPLLAGRVNAASPFAITLLLVLPLAAGTVVGALAVNRLKHTRTPLGMVHLGIMLEAVALFFFSPACALLFRLLPGPDPVVFVWGFSVAAAITAGVGNVLVMISFQTYLQRETTDEQRGRVFGSFLTIMNSIGLPVLLLLSHFGTLAPVDVVLTMVSIALLLMAGASFSSIAIRLHHAPYRTMP